MWLDKKFTQLLNKVDSILKLNKLIYVLLGFALMILSLLVGKHSMILFFIIAMIASFLMTLGINKKSKNDK
jgi:hypothetical protein